MSLRNDYLQYQFRMEKYFDKQKMLENLKQLNVLKLGKIRVIGKQETRPGDTGSVDIDIEKGKTQDQEEELRNRYPTVNFETEMSMVIEVEEPAQYFDEYEQLAASVSHVPKAEETFFRDITYWINHSDFDCVLQFHTLMDTGSGTSFIKESIVPVGAIEEVGEFARIIRGINGSKVIVCGLVKLDIMIDRVIKKNQIILVVPDTTMRPLVILGRDVITNFGLLLMNPLENTGLEEISSDGPSQRVSESVIIKSHPSVEKQSIVEELFKNGHFELMNPD